MAKVDQTDVLIASGHEKGTNIGVIIQRYRGPDTVHDSPMDQILRFVKVERLTAKSQVGEVRKE